MTFGALKFYIFYCFILFVFCYCFFVILIINSGKRYFIIVFCTCLQGFLMNRIVAYLESSRHNLVYGVGLVLAAFVCDVVRSITLTKAHVYGSQTGLLLQD